MNFGPTNSMKTTLALLLAGFASTSLLAGDLSDEVKAAAQKLADKPGYSWTAKSDSPQATAARQGADQAGQAGGRQRGRFGGGGGAPDGKTEKGGFTVLSYKTGETTTEVVVKGDKVAVKEGDEWKTADELKDAGDAGGGVLHRSQWPDPLARQPPGRSQGQQHQRRSHARNAQVLLAQKAHLTFIGRPVHRPQSGQRHDPALKPHGQLDPGQFAGRQWPTPQQPAVGRKQRHPAAPACEKRRRLIGRVSDPGNSKEVLARLEGAGQVEIKLVMTPPWTPDRMSEDARDQLGIF